MPHYLTGLAIRYIDANTATGPSVKPSLRIAKTILREEHLACLNAIRVIQGPNVRNSVEILIPTNTYRILIVIYMLDGTRLVQTSKREQITRAIELSPVVSVRIVP